MSAADRLLLEVANRRRLGADLTDAIVAVERGGSLETDSAFPSLTVTVDDPRDRLMTSNVLVRPAERALGSPVASTLRPIDVLLDGVWYRLRKASRSGDSVALTFNHRGVVYMAQHDTPMSASRADMTRAQAIRRQVLEAGRHRGAGHRLAFWAYELRRRMPIAKADESTSSRSESTREVGDTLSDADTLKRVEVGGKELDAGQRKNAALVFAQANADNAPPKAMLALAEACIVEPTGYRDPSTGKVSGPFDNPKGGDSSSVGILQLLSMHGSAAVRRDVRHVVHLFLTKGFTGRGGAIALARSNPGASAGEIAGMVQGPRADLIHRYNDVRRDAERVVAAFGGTTGGTADTGGGSYTKAFRFRRPRGENAWTNTGKLADEVHKRRFVTIPQRGSDLFAYAADVDLLKLRAQASIDLDARYVIGAKEYDLDYGKTARAMRVTLAGDPFEMDFAWGLPVVVHGAPDGRWLVWEVHEVDGSPVVELDLRQPEAAQPEPRSETVQRADTSDSAPDTGVARIEGGLDGTPKAIIDRYVIPQARSHGMNTGTTVAGVEAANGAHSQLTTSGSVSDHKGPPARAWAADMSNTPKGNFDRSAPTPQMDKLAKDLAEMFGIDWHGSGIAESHPKGYRCQMLYRTDAGGGHWNHVHFGIRVD